MKAHKIPPMLKTLHPMLSDHEYEVNRDNPSFLSKVCLVCTGCYLDLTSTLAASGKQPETFYNMLIGDPDYDLALMHSTKGMGPLRPDRNRNRLRITMNDIKERQDVAKYHDKTFKEFMEEYLVPPDDDANESARRKVGVGIRSPKKTMSMTGGLKLRKGLRGSPMQSDAASISSTGSPIPFDKSLSLKDELSSVKYFLS